MDRSLMDCSFGEQEMGESEKRKHSHVCNKGNKLRCISIIFLSAYFFVSFFSFSIVMFQHSRHLELPSSACSPTVQRSTERMLLGIFSQGEEKERRSLMRRTVLSNSNFCSFLHIHHSGEATHLKCTIFYVFVLGNPTNIDDLDCDPNPWEILNFSKEKANAGESDLLYLSVRENMNTGKSQSFFSFSAKVVDLFGFSYVAKMDSDTFINIKEMRSFMQKHLPVTKEKYELLVYGGILMDYTLCGGSIFKHCNLLYPAKVYMQGGLYFLSSSLTKFIALKCTMNPASTMQASIEDIDVGLSALSADNLVLVPLNHRSFWYHPIKNETLWDDLWLKQQNNELQFTGCHFWPHCTDW